MVNAGSQEPEGEAEAAAQIPLISISVSSRCEARCLSGITPQAFLPESDFAISIDQMATAGFGAWP